MPGPKERQSRTDHQTRLEDVVFNVFEDVNDSSANDLSGLYLKLNKKVDPGSNIVLKSVQSILLRNSKKYDHCY